MTFLLFKRKVIIKLQASQTIQNVNAFKLRTEKISVHSQEISR